MLRAIGIVVRGALLALFVSLPAHATPERRVALIIGNDGYKSMKRLDNGANDARAIAAELKAAGFETVLKVNAGRKEMHNAIDEFGGKLASGSVGLFYYAGHGIQSGDKNFLVPVDADLQSEADLDADAIDAGKVMRAMEAAHNRLNIVILDACRDNPLPKGGRSGSRGLTVIPAPTGTLVAYATSPGKIAQDGDRGGNGVYTGELVKALRQPGLKIEEVFKVAAAGVVEKTGGKQVPWTQASLQGDFYFRPSSVAPVARNEPAGTGNSVNDGLFWSSIKDSSRASDFEAYLQQFPNGTFASLARNRLEDLKGARTASLSPGAVQSAKFALEALDREMVAGRKASVREAPEARAKLVSTLSEGDPVQVTGKVKGENWFEVSRKGQIGYVVTDTLEEPKTYKARKDREAQAEAGVVAARAEAAEKEARALAEVAARDAQARAEVAAKEAKRQQHQQQVAMLGARPGTYQGQVTRSNTSGALPSRRYVVRMDPEFRTGKVSVYELSGSLTITLNLTGSLQNGRVFVGMAKASNPDAWTPDNVRITFLEDGDILWHHGDGTISGDGRLSIE